MKNAALRALALLLLVTPPASAQRRGDYLTDQEQDVVRTLQAIDKRTAAFLRIADRRILAITAPDTKLDNKEIDMYGALPKGSQVELLDDYRRAIDELMDKIDDALQQKGRGPAFDKALKTADEAATRQVQALEALRPKLTEPDAPQFLLRALESVRMLGEGARTTLAGGDGK